VQYDSIHDGGFFIATGIEMITTKKNGGGFIPGFHQRRFLDSKIQDIKVMGTRLFPPPPEYNSRATS
jgi:hypothetical protein